ncbi:MAG: hypothetical protein OEM38_01520 [Gammaproteobacteria bacterium]|nr:hypothetical protein [Gammaproteobacteria bacterium]
MYSNNRAEVIAYWDNLRHKIFSKKGGWVIGKGVFSHGFDMMKDLVGSKTYMQVLILNATGRLPEKCVADWFEARHICLSWPDSRIWCNHIGALGGTAQTSPVAATAAGLLGADSYAYGGSQTAIKGMAFIRQALKDKSSGLSVREIVEAECKKFKGKPVIMGYARPIAKGDERIEAMERVGENLGFKVGKHLSLAYEIEQHLVKEFGEGMNINGFSSAFIADLGYTGEEVYRISATIVASGVTACYSDSKDKPANGFLPLQCADVEYSGKPDRKISDNK